jgi:hypothetical protein
MSPCDISTWPAAIPSAGSVIRPRRRRCSSRSPVNRRSGSDRAFRFSVPITRHQTVRACATTSTSRILRTRTSGRSIISSAGRLYDAQLRLRPWLQRARGARDGRARARIAARDQGGAAQIRGSAIAGRGTHRDCARGARLAPRYDDLELIVRTQLAWEHRLLRESELQRTDRSSLVRRTGDKTRG